METDIDREALKKEIEIHFESLISTNGEILVDIIQELISEQQMKKPQATIVNSTKKHDDFDNYFGMWQDKTDMEDSSAWVRKIRKSEWHK